MKLRKWFIYNPDGKLVGQLLETEKEKVMLIDGMIFNWSPSGFLGSLKYIKE